MLSDLKIILIITGGLGLAVTGVVVAEKIKKHKAAIALANTGNSSPAAVPPAAPATGWRSGIQQQQGNNLNIYDAPMRQQQLMGGGGAFVVSQISDRPGASNVVSQISERPGASNTPSTPAQAQSALQAAAANALSSVNNNYCVYSAGMIKYLKDSGNVSIANVLSAQLTCSVNGAGTIPVYSDQQATSVFPTGRQTGGRVPFTIPSNSFPTVSDVNGIRKAVLLNCAVVMTIVAENYVLSFDEGQAVGQRQQKIRACYTALKAAAGDINTIPELAAGLITVFDFAKKDVWPSGVASGAITTSQILSAVGTAAAIAALCL